MEPLCMERLFSLQAVSEKSILVSAPGRLRRKRPARRLQPVKAIFQMTGNGAILKKGYAGAIPIRAMM
jgi:hypothetical protein